MKFNQCPNCKSVPSGGVLSGLYFKIFECKKCGTCYCYKCGRTHCPNCGSKEAKTVGECWAKT